MEYLELVIRDLEKRTNAAIETLSARTPGPVISLGVATFQISAESVKIVDDKLKTPQGV